MSGETKRLTILLALAEHLKTIDGTAPYTHDVGNRVFIGRGQFSSREAVPAINILEMLNPDRDPDVAGGDQRAQHKEDWVLLVQGWAEDDKVNPTVPAHKLMGDVKLCLSKIALEAQPGEPENEDFMLGGLIGGLKMEPGTCRPPDEMSELAFFYMRISLEVVEKVFNPFDLT